MITGQSRQTIFSARNYQAVDINPRGNFAETLHASKKYFNRDISFIKYQIITDSARKKITSELFFLDSV